MCYFWINPVGLITDTTDSDKEEIDNSELIMNGLNKLLDTAQINVDHLQELQHFMLNEYFSHLEPESLVSQEFDFLSFPESVIDDVNLALPDIFQQLQKFAVALYQILQETEKVDAETEYYTKLYETKEKMIRLLVDVQLLITISQLEQHPDVTYDMLPAHMKTQLQFSQMSIRDFIIIRDYTRFIQYILQQINNFR